ncbi:S41 family peptidase [Microbulbifer sp. GL-2]|uniref:S41 family peptidase n=1 Tax=Microbulbifer sp. GL-2 TaxID=2591606 RepID=UPI001161E490|nr:S41 family peptidase [Microbulbifer sp. GL-2]BBM00075.1 hypothetical protein GL2_01490 [Microbulbifer sp. GL-2]
MHKTIILAFLLITICLLGMSVKRVDITNEKSNSELWKEDIDYYKSTLKDKHINLYHSINNVVFNQKIEDLTNKLSSLNKHEIMVEMMGITRSIGDGHTQFSAMGGPHEHYPFSLEWVDGKIRVMAASTKFKNLLGNELIAIDGVPLDEVLDKINPVIQGVENKYSLRSGYRWHLNVSELLYGLHITSALGHATFTFFDENKSRININANAISMNEFMSDVIHRLSLDRGIFSHPDIKKTDGLWLSVNRPLRTAYLHFSNYPSRSEMQSFAEDVEDYLNKNNIQNLIIDLRENGGGDFFLGLLLANHLILVDGLNWNNGIYVLIGGHTYSAGMSNAAQYRSILNATLVGEPTGANPIGYQDADGFTLPNSKRYVQYSKRMYRFQNNSTNGVIPDHHIINDWESYATGKDKQLAYITSLIRKARDNDVQ